jgi:hypothetical protein
MNNGVAPDALLVHYQQIAAATFARMTADLAWAHARIEQLELELDHMKQMKDRAREGT